MTTITEKQLIESLKSLKGIKPRQEWASLLKSQILAEKQVEIKVQPARFADLGNIFSAMFSQRKLAYSLAAILILIAGAFGLANLSLFEKAPQKSTASLTGQTSKTVQIEAQKKAVALNSKIRDLNQALKNNPVQDPQTIKNIKNIADSLKVLADVPGTDLSQSHDIKDLYQTLVLNQVYDLKQSTLTIEQKKALTEIQDLYNQGKYSEALEKILLINK